MFTASDIVRFYLFLLVQMLILLQRLLRRLNYSYLLLLLALLRLGLLISFIFRLVLAHPVMVLRGQPDVVFGNNHLFLQVRVGFEHSIIGLLPELLKFVDLFCSNHVSHYLVDYSVHLFFCFGSFYCLFVFSQLRLFGLLRNHRK